jgi:hypothetical protein
MALRRTGMREAVESGSAGPHLKQRRLALRVRDFRKGEFWYAECIDLSLITRRPDRDEALKVLIEQVNLYLQDARESGHWERMVPRPASWRRAFWYYFDVVMVTGFVRRRSASGVGRATYRIPTDGRGNLVWANA